MSSADKWAILFLIEWACVNSCSLGTVHPFCAWLSRKLQHTMSRKKSVFFISTGKIAQGFLTGTRTSLKHEPQQPSYN